METTKTWQWGIAGLVLAAVLVGNVILTYNVLTSQFPGMNDFLSRWEGARSFVQEGLSPYSDEASLNIQERIYGRAAQGTEDPGLFAYPFYTVFYVWPTLHTDYAWASAMWMVLLEVCLIAGMLLLLRLYRWQPALWLLPVLLLWSLLDYFAGRGLFLGQPSHVVYFLQMLTIFAVLRGWGGVAGAALALSTMKPQMGYLFVPLILLWALVAGRRRLIAGFGVTFGLLMGASFLLQPDWFGAWLEQVRLYPEYTAAAYPDTGSPVWIITQHYLGLGDAAEWAVNILLLLPVAWAWYGLLIQRREDRWLWTVVLTLVAGHLIALRTATPHFVVFNIALIFYFKRLAETRGNGAVLVVVVLLAIFNWAQFIITVQGRDSLEHPSMFLPLSFGIYALVLLTRRMWWQHAPAVDAPAQAATAHEA